MFWSEVKSAAYEAPDDLQSTITMYKRKVTSHSDAPGNQICLLRTSGNKVYNSVMHIPRIPQPLKKSTGKQQERHSIIQQRAPKIDWLETQYCEDNYPKGYLATMADDSV